LILAANGTLGAFLADILLPVVRAMANAAIATELKRRIAPLTFNQKHLVVARIFDIIARPGPGKDELGTRLFVAHFHSQTETVSPGCASTVFVLLTIRSRLPICESADNTILDAVVNMHYS
jgi:hypothetical protein